VSATGRFSPDGDADAETLSPLELQFIDLVVGGAAMDEAATALGKSPRTLRRWKRQPKIAEAIRERATELMALARATLASAANRAARELDKLASSAKPDAARIAACRAVLENATKFGELEALEARLAELEARLNEQPSGRRFGP
jgi:Spy/CpxP family protein refolding chaperone